MWRTLQRYLKCICLVAVYLIAFSSRAQESSPGKPYNIKASYNLGFMLAHRVPMQHIPQTLTHGVELSIEKQSENQKDWEKLYNNPTVGMAFLLTSSGNESILGTAIGVNGYVLIPIVKTDKFILNSSWGWGLGWLTKKFDPVTNYRNNVIGSHLNLFASIKAIGEYYVNPQLAIQFGASFHHWSNSAYKYPNLGVNLPSVNIGAIYKFQPENNYGRLTKQERRTLDPDIKNEFSVIPSVGFKAYSIQDNSTYPAYTLEFNYARLFSSKWKLSGGLDLFYNTAYDEELNRSSDPSNHDKSAFQTGLNVTYHQTIGGFSLLLGMGAYVIDQTLQNEIFYHRLGTRFCIKERIIISTVLHSHWARADHMKLGIGYKFRK